MGANFLNKIYQIEENFPFELLSPSPGDVIAL